MAKRPCPECGSSAVRWRLKNDGGNNMSLFSVLFRSKAAGWDYTHPDNRNLNPFRYFNPKPTPEEQAVVDAITEPFELAPGERVVAWRCAACSRSGELIEKRNVK